MSMLSTKSEFDKLAAAIGNTYAAVRFVSKKARNLSIKYDNQILDSEAISWVVTGKKPKSAVEYDKLIHKYNHIQHMTTKHIKSVVHEYLCYVDDEAVCKSVKASMKASKEARHLVYVYIDVDTDYQEARVRILTRMIWYSL